MMFEITNPRKTQHRLHCGVLEFIAQEGMVYLPFWMMENMRLNEGDIIHLRSATIRKGTYVKLQPQTTDFIKISNPKAVLEQVVRMLSSCSQSYGSHVVQCSARTCPSPCGCPDMLVRTLSLTGQKLACAAIVNHRCGLLAVQSLRNFSALTKGETFRILYNKKKYDIGVVEVRGAGGDFAQARRPSQ